MIVDLPDSIHLAPPTHLEDNHNHSHRPPISRPPSVQTRLSIHHWATLHLNLLRITCASRTRGEFATPSLISCATIRIALKQTLSQPNCPNSHFFTQHQHSPPAHIVIPAVNPISATRLSTSSHENNASPQQRNVLPLQTT